MSITFIGVHSLSFAALSSSLREGAGNGCGGGCHSTGYSLNRGVAGDFRRPYETQKSFPFTIHRTTLPQRGSREGRLPFNRVLAKPQGCGRFSSPLRNSEIFTFHHSSGDTPSVSFADSSLREGAGIGAYHSTGYSLNRKGTGDFHRPYGTQKCLHSTIQPGWGAFWVGFLWEIWKIKYNGCKLNQNDVK